LSNEKNLSRKPLNAWFSQFSVRSSIIPGPSTS
jgi:hypothetical protein